MINYPRIYSFSTVGIVMHYNQDYLLHHIRTDFTGRNGIGKSLIADLFQLLFIADKKKVVFGTDSLINDDRNIHTLPYKTSDAYVFVNIEVEKDYFISFGVNIPNKKSRPLKSFWILNKAYGINDNEKLKDLAIYKDNIPMFKDFTTDDVIPPIEKLAIQLRDNKGLYLKSFTDKAQKNELYTFLFEKEILPINLSIDSNLSAFAKVIQSFSKAKTLNTDDDESLKNFLFEDSTDSFETEYNRHKTDLEKLITDYKELEELINDIDNKNDKLLKLSSIRELYLNAYEDYLSVEFIHTKSEIDNQQKRLDDLNLKLKSEKEEIEKLKAKNPKTEKAIKNAKKEIISLQKSHEKLEEYKIIYDKILALKLEIKELDEIDFPNVDKEKKKLIKIEDYEIGEIKRKINHFASVYNKYESIEKIELKIDSQKLALENYKEKLKKNRSDLTELINLLSKNKKGSLFSQLFAEKKILTASQEAVLMHTLKDINWKRPNNVIAGLRYVESLDFLDEKFIEVDKTNNGFWFDLGSVKEFVPKNNEKQLFSDKDKLEEVLTNQKEKIDQDNTIIDNELAEIEAFIRGDEYNSKLIKLDYEFDQDLKDFSQLKELKIGLSIVQNIETKKQDYLKQIKNEEKSLKCISKEIDFKIENENLDKQIESLNTKKNELDANERKLSSTFSSDTATLNEKLKFLPTIENQPSELEKKVKDLKSNLEKLIKESKLYFPDLILDRLEVKRFNGIERTPVFTEFQNNKISYYADYKSIVQSFEQIKNDSEIKEQITNETFNFEVLERTLLGPKIKHTGNITEALRQANSTRLTMTGAIHETMLNIFKQTKGKYDQYDQTIKSLNRFFKGKKISGKYYFQIEFNTPNEFKIDWINKLQSSSQQAYKQGELPFGETVETFVENFFMRATGLNERIKFSSLLDPKTYFELKTKFTDEYDVKKPGSTGESYAAIVLLGIGRLSVVLDSKRTGLRFLILEEVSNLDSSNFSTFPSIAEEFDYQILTMTPRPYGSDTKQGWYLHHLIEGAGDKYINYPIPNSFYKTNEGRKELDIYLKTQTN